MKFTFAPEAVPLAGYTIKRAIDRGGFGEVYYALSDSGKEVALKLLQRNQQVELRGIRQCLNLKHPNLVTIFDIKTDADDDHWVVMEFVSGKSLEQVLADNPKGLPLDDVESWLAGMAAGTAFLHDRGIVHRDLKPANVFRENGVVKIGDVGLSKFITPSRRSAQTESVGTVYYMAPEVARGKYGSELDVYSLGVILYEMITGSVPFSGESTGEILMKHLTEPPDLSKIPAQFRAVVGKALEKDPQRRTPGAARLLEDFRRARQGRPIAEEIPASHFVDVPQLERSALLKPASPAPSARQPYLANEPTVHYPHPGVNGENPYPRPRPPSPPVPLARELGAATRSVGQMLGDLGSEIRKRPWLAIVIVIGLLVVFPRLGLADGKLLFLVGLSLATYFAVKSVVGKAQSPARAGNQAAGAPPPPALPVQPVVLPRPVVPPPPPVRPAAVKKPAPPLIPWTVREISFTRRMGELTGAMTMAVVWGLLATAAVSGLATKVPFLQTERDLLTAPGGMGIFGLTTIIGAWAVLFSSKLFEGTATSGRERRLILTALGAAVGALAFGLQQDLLTDLPIHSMFPGIFKHVGEYSLTTNSSINQPSLAGFVLYFAALFGIRRWWLLADSYRSKRFRVASVLFTGLIAFVIPAAFIFEQNWGLLWGVAISTVVQLSAPWTAPKNRQAPATV
jgi:serine/threonine protein kinase